MASRVQQLKDHWKEQRLFLSRVIGAAVVVLLLTGVLISRLVYLQVIEYDNFRSRSEGNLVRIQTLNPARGQIYDRNGNPLAENMPTMQLVAIPEFIEDDIDSLLFELGRLELIDPGTHEVLAESIRTSTRRWEPVLLANLDEVQSAEFAARSHQFRGIDIQAGLVRYYRFGEAFAHTVGYVGSPSEADYDQFGRANYTGTSQVGKSGLERYYEEALHGSVGRRPQIVDAHGRPVSLNQQMSFIQDEPTTPGQHVGLTLDLNLQLAAFQALQGMRGSVVALDPRTGEVLTMVSMPSFDPNSFATGISQAEYTRLTTDPSKPFINRAIAEQYNPGSTVKPFLGLAGLYYETEHTSEDHFCEGEFRLPGSSYIYDEGTRVIPHGETDVYSAIVRSCNVFFYELAVELEIDRMEEFMKRFGFGQRTGIDIGGEYSGLMPGREWKRTAFRDSADRVWYPGETVITGIGQGFIEVTPLQLAHATAAIAMRGERFSPQLLASTEDAQTSERTAASRLALTPVDDVDALHWDQIHAAMNDVTSLPEGTADQAMADAPYTTAGKTGTAQVIALAQDEDYDAEAIDESYRDNALFIAYAPVEDPEIAIAVVIENVADGGGGTNAAPVARKVLDEWFGPDSEVEYVAQLLTF